MWYSIDFLSIKNIWIAPCALWFASYAPLPIHNTGVPVVLVIRLTILRLLSVLTHFDLDRPIKDFSVLVDLIRDVLVCQCIFISFTRFLPSSCVCPQSASTFLQVPLMFTLRSPLSSSHGDPTPAQKPTNCSLTNDWTRVAHPSHSHLLFPFSSLAWQFHQSFVHQLSVKIPAHQGWEGTDLPCEKLHLELKDRTDTNALGNSLVQNIPAI